MWLCNPDETKNFWIGRLRPTNGSPKFSRWHPALCRLRQCGFGSYIIDTPVLPIILEKLFSFFFLKNNNKIKGVNCSWHQACFVDAVKLPQSGHRCCCADVWSFIISVSRSPQCRRPHYFGKLTVPQHSTAAWPQLQTDVSQPSWNTLVFIVDATQSIWGALCLPFSQPPTVVE